MKNLFLILVFFFIHACLFGQTDRMAAVDNIQKFLPDFPDYGMPLTIRHFIHHTSGVRDYPSDSTGMRDKYRVLNSMPAGYRD
jgi:CubicO group peptidase (beta-lactamase class C family)